MKEEVKLWYSFLKNYPVSFNRFKIIDRYIADFYCEKAKLAIELCDDPDEDIKNKKAKIRLFETMGIKLMFFKKSMVIEQFEHVCDAIDFFVKTRME